MAKLIVVDVEADGQVPGTDMFSMVCFGAVVVDKNGRFDQTFYGQTAPISNRFDPDALAISGFSREDHLTFNDPLETMKEFDNWLKEIEGGKIFISDNLAFDWQYINYYFHKFLGRNPFGFSGQRIGDKFQGFYNDPYMKWKKYRDSKRFPHNHDPVSDAQGNASALYYLYKQGYKLF